MISKARDVDSYMREVPAGRQATMEKLRALCRKLLAGHDECIEYGMPVYKLDGAMHVAFASQKQYIALYVTKKDVVDEFRDSLGASSIGKGCIRFTRPEQIDFKVIEGLLRRTAKSKAAAC
ncbi:MAG TPA: DUF1801 domain-containing protein [Bryobacteraceae bacterium]|nr:DUF1801 domain-containing protein [Bryobacteraceae bacterium]